MFVLLAGAIGTTCYSWCEIWVTCTEIYVQPESSYSEYVDQRNAYVASLHIYTLTPSGYAVILFLLFWMTSTHIIRMFTVHRMRSLNLPGTRKIAGHNCINANNAVQNKNYAARMRAFVETFDSNFVSDI